MTKIQHFFKNGHASHLQILRLISNKIGPSEISKFCEVLGSEHFVELRCLDFSRNPICDEGADVLFNTLMKRPCECLQLILCKCLLTSRCVPTLVKTLQSENCKIGILWIEDNDIGDEGVRLLCENALTKEHCKLLTLHLDCCSLTKRCISDLCKALQDERCKLTVLSLSENQIGDEGACVLFEDGITKEHCKLTELNISENSLTDKCIPRLCKVLQDERCKLTKLSLYFNNFTNDGKDMLSDVQKCKSCEASGLKIIL